MKSKERHAMYVKICERAESLGFEMERLTLLMDIESADYVFNLRLEELLAADDYNFAHDIAGIVKHIDRSEFPAKDFNFFIPRYAGN